MKTAAEILKETFDYYNEDVARRAKDLKYDACEYLTNDGRMCAFGRCEKNPPRECEGTIYQRFGSCASDVDIALRPEYHGHSLRFWGDVQYFHDRDKFWNDNGITAIGLEYYHTLAEQYS